MVAGSAAIRGRCRRMSCASSGTSRCRHKLHFALGASIAAVMSRARRVGKLGGHLPLEWAAKSKILALTVNFEREVGSGYLGCSPPQRPSSMGLLLALRRGHHARPERNRRWRWSSAGGEVCGHAGEVAVCLGVCLRGAAVACILGFYGLLVCTDVSTWP
jgi:hypothetical protein